MYPNFELPLISMPHLPADLPARTAGALRRQYVRGKLAEDAALSVLRRNPGARLSSLAHGVLARVHRDALASLPRQFRDTPPAGDRRLRLGVPQGTTLVTPYDPTWADLYEFEAAQLRQWLGPRLAAVHHIGSTAVPGLAAKPIIDLAVGLVPARDGSERMQAARHLERIGYRFLGDRRGLGGYFLEKGPAPLRTHAVQLHVADSPELRRLLRFRAALREIPALAAEYAAIKRGLAATVGDDRRLYLWYKAHWVNGLLLGRTDPHAWGEWLLAQDPPSYYRMHLRRRARLPAGASP